MNDFNSKLTAFSKGAVKKVWDKAKKEEEIKKSIAQKQVDATIRAELSENPHLTLKELSGILEPTVYVIRFTGDMTVCIHGMSVLINTLDNHVLGFWDGHPPRPDIHDPSAGQPER